MEIRINTAILYEEDMYKTKREGMVAVFNKCNSRDPRRVNAQKSRMYTCMENRKRKTSSHQRRWRTQQRKKQRACNKKREKAAAHFPLHLGTLSIVDAFRSVLTHTVCTVGRTAFQDLLLSAAHRFPRKTTPQKQSKHFNAILCHTCSEASLPVASSVLLRCAVVVRPVYVPYRLSIEKRLSSSVKK